jgi:hypothetical protein
MATLNKGIKLTADSTVIKLNNRVFETTSGTAFITIRPDVATANGMVTLLDPGKTTGAATDGGHLKVSINHVDTGLSTAGFYWVVETLGTAGQTINTLQSDRVSYGAESTLGLTYDATTGTLKFALNSVDTVFTPSNINAFTAGVVPVVSGLNLATTSDATQTIGIDNYSGFLSKIATYSSVFSSEDLKKYTDDPSTLPTKDQVLLLDATQLNAASTVNNSVPEVQKLTFGAAAASGVITIDGSTGLNNGAKIVVTKGDSGTTIAAKVQKALSESLLFKPQLEKQLVTFSPNTANADAFNGNTSFLVAGVPVTVNAATYETQVVAVTGTATLAGSVNFLGVPTSGLGAGNANTVIATAIAANKATILLGPVARAAGITNITADGAGNLTLTFGGTGGTGDVPNIPASPDSNGASFSAGVQVVQGVIADTADDTATDVKAALDASAFIRGASALGRSIVNNGDGSLTITYNSADGNAKPLAIDSKTTTVKASVDTIQTFNAAGAVGRTVKADGASVLITASAADQNLPDLFTNVGSTGVVITKPNLGNGVQTQEFTSFVPSTFDFEGAPLGEIQRMTFTTGAVAAGETLSFVINGVTQTAIIPANPLGNTIPYTTAETAAKIAELLTLDIANLTDVDTVTASGDFVDVQFNSEAGNVADLTIPTSNTAKAILTTPQQFAQNLAGETQTITFTTAQSSGNIIVDGITVAIVSGDTSSQIATKVQKALVDSGVSDAGSTSSLYSIPETQAITFTNAAASAGTITVNGVTVTLLATDSDPEDIAAKAAAALNGITGNNYFATADGDTLLVMFDNVARDAPLMSGLVAGTRTGDTATAFSTLTEFDSNGLRTTRVNGDGSLGIDFKPWEGTTAELGNIAPVKVDTTGYFVAEKQTVLIAGPATAAAPVTFLGVATGNPAGTTITNVGDAIVAAKVAILAGSQAQALGLTDIANNAGTLTLTFGGPGGLGDVPNIAANTVASNGITFAAGAQIANVPETQTVLIAGPATAATPVTFLGVATGNPAGTTIINVGDAIVASKAAILAGTQAKALGLTDITNTAGTLTLTFGGPGGLGDVPNIAANAVASNGVTFGAGTQVQASTAPTNYPTTASVATTAEAHAQNFTSSSYTGAVVANGGAASSNAMYAELVSVGNASASSKQLVFNVFLDPSLKSKAAIGTGYESVGFTLNYPTTDITSTTVKVDMAASRSSPITNLNTPGKIVARWFNSTSETDFTKPIATVTVDQIGSFGVFKDKLDLTFSSVDVDGLDLTDGTTFTRTIDESLRPDRWDVKQKLVYGIDHVTPVGGTLVGYYGNPTVASPLLSLKYASFKDQAAAGVIGGAVTTTLTNPNKTLGLDIVSGVAAVKSADFVIELPSDVINPTFTLSPAAIAAGMTLTPASATVVQGLVGHYYFVKLSTTNLAGLAKDATIGTLSMDLIKGKDKTFEFLLGEGSALNGNKVANQGAYFGYTATEETTLNSATGLTKGEWMAKDMPKGTFNKFFVDTAPSNANKVISAADALQILKLSAGYGLDWKPGAIPDAAFAAADIDGSGKITAADALIALKYASGVIPANDPVVRKFFDSSTANLTIESTALNSSLKKDMAVAGGADVEIGIANANKDYFVEAILVGNVTNPALEI